MSAAAGRPIVLVTAVLAALGLIVGVVVALGVAWIAVALPVVILLLVTLTSAVSTYLSALYVRRRDVAIIWGVAATAASSPRISRTAFVYCRAMSLRRVGDGKSACVSLPGPSAPSGASPRTPVHAGVTSPATTKTRGVNLPNRATGRPFPKRARPSLLSFLVIAAQRMSRLNYEE